jgi:hypothetical protein
MAPAHFERRKTSQIDQTAELSAAMPLGAGRAAREPLSRRERGRGEGTDVSDKGQPQFLANPRQHSVEIVAHLGVS